MFWLLEQLIGNAEDLEPLSPFSRPIKCQWLGVSLSMQIEKMKFPAMIPNVIYTCCFEYVLSVMSHKSCNGVGTISSYLLKTMKEKNNNLEFPNKVSL
jgi:hypothetical protein